MADPVLTYGKARLYHADCFTWLAEQPERSIQGVVTDPPYGVVEYSDKELAKLRENQGRGIWRLPPAFDGNVRAPLPRFTAV